MLDIEHKQFPYAMMLALNDTARSGRKAIQTLMRKKLDRPTPFALRGVVYEQATRHRLEAAVVIYGSRSPRGGLPAAYFLGPQVSGGQRSLKAFEVQLQDRGLLPQGHVVVPAERTRLDRYGNVSQGQINRIMSRLQIDYRGAGATRVASTKRGKARNKRGSRRGFYFVPHSGSHLAPGIWFEAGFPARAVFPVMLFVRAPTYSKRLPFEHTLRKHVDKTLPRNFARSWRRALATAR